MLIPDTTCLVIVDIQEKLLPVMADPEQVVRNTSILIRIAGKLDIPILWCQQVPQALGPTAKALTSLLEGVEPIDKSCFSCCGSDMFCSRLGQSNAQNIILCGIEAHVCVFQTAADLLGKGLNVHVIADATSSRTPANKQIAIDRMRQAGVIISSTEMCLFEMLRDAKHDHFRDLAKLIK